MNKAREISSIRFNLVSLIEVLKVPRRWRELEAKTVEKLRSNNWRHESQISRSHMNSQSKKSLCWKSKPKRRTTRSRSRMMKFPSWKMLRTSWLRNSMSCRRGVQKQIGWSLKIWFQRKKMIWSICFQMTNNQYQTSNKQIEIISNPWWAQSKGLNN